MRMMITLSSSTVFTALVVLVSTSDAFLPRLPRPTVRNHHDSGVLVEHQMSPPSSYEEQMDEYNNNNNNLNRYRPTNDDYRANERNAAFRRAVELREQQQQQAQPFHTIPQRNHQQPQTPRQQQYDGQGRMLHTVNNNNPFTRRPLDPEEYRRRQRNAYFEQTNGGNSNPLGPPQQPLQQFDPEAYWREQRNLAFQRATRNREAAQQHPPHLPPVEWREPVQNGMPAPASNDNMAQEDQSQEDVLFPPVPEDPVQPDSMVPVVPEAEVSPMASTIVDVAKEHVKPEYLDIPETAVPSAVSSQSDGSTVTAGLQSMQDAVEAMNKLSVDSTIPPVQPDTSVPPPVVTLSAASASKIAPKKRTPSPPMAEVPATIVASVATPLQDKNDPNEVIPEEISAIDAELKLPLPPKMPEVKATATAPEPVAATNEKPKDASVPKTSDASVVQPVSVEEPLAAKETPAAFKEPAPAQADELTAIEASVPADIVDTPKTTSSSKSPIVAEKTSSIPPAKNIIKSAETNVEVSKVTAASIEDKQLKDSIATVSKNPDTKKVGDDSKAKATENLVSDKIKAVTGKAANDKVIDAKKTISDLSKESGTKVNTETSTVSSKISPVDETNVAKKQPIVASKSQEKTSAVSNEDAKTPVVAETKLTEAKVQVPKKDTIVPKTSKASSVAEDTVATKKSTVPLKSSKEPPKSASVALADEKAFISKKSIDDVKSKPIVNAIVSEIPKDASNKAAVATEKLDAKTSTSVSKSSEKASNSAPNVPVEDKAPVAAKQSIAVAKQVPKAAAKATGVEKESAYANAKKEAMVVKQEATTSVDASKTTINSKSPQATSTNKQTHSDMKSPTTEAANANVTAFPTSSTVDMKSTKDKSTRKQEDLPPNKEKQLETNPTFFADEKVITQPKKADMDSILVDAAVSAIMNQSFEPPSVDAANNVPFDEDTEKLLERAMSQLESTQKEMSEVKEMIQAPLVNVTASPVKAVKPPLPKEAPSQELISKSASNAKIAVESKIDDLKLGIDPAASLKRKQQDRKAKRDAKAALKQVPSAVTDSNSTVLSQMSALLEETSKAKPSDGIVVARKAYVDPDSRWFSVETKEGVEPRTLQGVALATAFLSTFVVGSAPIITAAAVPAAAYLAVCRGTTGNLARELGNLTMNCVEPLVTTNATAEVITSAAKLVKHGIEEISSMKPPKAVKKYLEKPFAKNRATLKIAQKTLMKSKAALKSEAAVPKGGIDNKAKEEITREIAAQIKRDQENAPGKRVFDSSVGDVAMVEPNKIVAESSNNSLNVSAEAKTTQVESDAALDEVRAAVLTKVEMIDESSSQPFAFLDSEVRAEVNARALLAKRLELQRLEANRKKN